MSKTSMRMAIVVVNLAAFMAGSAVAGTGYGISGRVTIDNRTGSGFRVTSLNSQYGVVFVGGVGVTSTITATVDWAGMTASKVVFSLNGATKEISTSGPTAQTSYNMGSALQYSAAGAKNVLTVWAVASNGQQSQSQQLALWGLQLPQWATSPEGKIGSINWKLDGMTGRLVFDGKVELGKNSDTGGTHEIPEGIPTIGGEYGITIDPLKFDWEVAAQPSSNGLTGTFAVRNGQWGAHAAFGEDREGSLSATLSGSGQFYPQFRLTDLNATLQGGFKFSTPKLYLLCAWTGCCIDPCPYGYLTLEPAISGTLRMEEGEPSVFAGLKFKQAELLLEILVKGMVGVDGGWLGEAEGGIGGKPTIVLQFPKNPNSYCGSQYIKSIKFIITLEASERMLWWEKDWNTTFDIYECPKTKTAQLMAVDTTAGQSRPQMMNREYLLAPEGYCVFPDAQEAGARLMVGGLPEPILNVGPMSRPSVAVGGDHGLLVFVYDDASKPVGSHMEIYSARWNGSQWTAHAPVTDDLYPDVYPAAAIDDSAAEIVVWARAPEPTGLEDGPRDVLGGLDIVWSKYDDNAGAWASPAKLTDNDYVDVSPGFEKSADGDLRVVWMASAGDAIPVWEDEEIDPLIDVMAADWDGSGFGSPYTVASGLKTACPPAVCRTAAHEILAYLKDRDNNTATREDVEVVVRMRPRGGSWGDDHYLTTDTTADVSVDVAVDAGGTPLVVWTKRMARKTLPDGNDTTVDQVWFSALVGDAWMPPELAFEAQGISEPKFFRNEAGKIVLFWTALSAEFWDIYYSVYDAAHEQWSAPQQITHDQGAETMICPAESGGNILVGYVKRRIDLSDPDRPPQIGLSDIYLMEHVPSRDLFIGPNDISVDIRFNMAGLAAFSSYWLDEDCARPGANCASADYDGDGVVDFNDYALFARDRFNTITGYGRVADITAAVHLAGDFIVKDVNVDFYDGNPGTGVLIGSQTVAMLLPGQATPVVQRWYVPGDGRSHDIYVVVDPNNNIAETDDELNNTAFVTLFKPDLQPQSVAVIGYPAADSVLIGLSIGNYGEATADPFGFEVRKDSVDGEVIYAGSLGPIEAGASGITQFAWDVSGQAAGTYTLFVVADVNDDVAESREDNNVDCGQAAVLADLEAIQWSGRIEAGTAYITVRNVGAKPSLPTTVRATCDDQSLGTGTVAAINPGASVEVSFAVTEPGPGAVVEITVNPDSDGSDEVTLLNNTAIVIR